MLTIVFFFQPTTVKTPSLMTDYTSMVQPTRTTTLPASETKNTLAFSSTTSTMTTELKNMVCIIMIDIPLLHPYHIILLF